MNPDRELDLARRHPAYDAEALIDGGCAHGNGWFNIIDRMFSAVEVAQPEGVRWIQIKEKYGKLRIYADGCNPDTVAILLAAEAESVTVCDVCGAPGVQRSERRVATRCEAHRGPPRPPPPTEEEYAEYEARMLAILGDDPAEG